MSYLDTIKIARSAIDAANSELNSIAKEAINESVKQLLMYPDVRYVSFAQKGSEYNDEGMYPGVFGPAINEPFSVFDGEEGNDDRWDSWIYEYRPDVPNDPRLRDLYDILNGIGEEILSSIFGDECAVDFYIDNKGSFKYTSEYAGC